MKKVKYTEGSLDYLIITNGKVIARFDTNIDRDDCLLFLEERYEDCTFMAVDED